MTAFSSRLAQLCPWLPGGAIALWAIVGLSSPSLAQGIDFLDQQLEIPPIDQPNTPAHAAANRLFQLAQAAAEAGELAKAVQLWRGALVQYTELQDLGAIGVVHEHLGIAYLQLGYFNEAEYSFRQSLGAARDVGNAFRQVYALNNLGTMLLNRSDPQSAAESFAAAAELAQTIGSEAGEGLSLSNLGLAKAQMGDYTGAIAAYEIAWPLRRRYPHIGGHAYTLNNVGDAYQALDRHDQALAEYRLARWYAEEEGDIHNQFRAFEGLAYSYGRTQRWVNAFQALDDWINLARQTEEPRRELRALHLYAQYHVLLRRWPKARELYENAIAVSQRLDNPDTTTILRNELGQVLYYFPYGPDL
ncbi:tetratricopeptide repeat protein [Spirulina major]|uniref:tetratricopeptide repeat protein n=1 Tax=Spirulina major TaxID=270636 RepID=UPI0009343A6B|nr:tetratricopeptide repeat protein [Spirulina major]